ncbi:hypothetical protein G6F24_016914 [Rhizopus arrhizus]|nr:hypothetical protein G6F24_016914 [Rhizopus arrhizus]
MLRQHRIITALQVSVHARPWMVFRIGRHAGADRIELDIAIHAEQVAVAVNHGRMEAPLPERAAARMPLIERLDIAVALHAHCIGQAQSGGWRGQQMNMVAHQNVRMQRDVMFHEGVVQQVQE